MFLPPDDTICTDKATGGILKLYSNPDSSASDNKLDTIIEGRSDTGYSMHFTFDRDESDNLSGDQILFAAYENMSDGTAVAKAGIRSGEFFYEIGSEEINGVNMSALNDVSVSNPHIAIIVYDSRRQKVILNIDGAEVISENIKPISGISKISRIEFGKNYTGEMGMMYTYATKLSIDERVELVGMLAQSVNTKVIKPKIDERGVLVSGVDKEASVQCRPGKIFINGNCQNAVISGFTAPLNSAYDGDSNGDITYDPAHKGMDNAKLLDCNIGYEVGSVSPKYWFTLNGDLPSVHIDGTCVEKTYILGQDGNDSLPANAIDPGILTGSSLANYTSSNPKPLKCDPRHGKSADFGIYVDSNDILRSQGSCTYSSLNSPDCYNPSINPVGKIATSDGCAGMLVVDTAMLRASKAGDSFSFTHDGKTYTWTNDDNNIFTGQVTDMGGMFFNNSAFNGDISYWDTSSVTSMSGMFYGYNNTFNLDISSWDTSSVTNMHNMFYNSAFNNNSISNWDISNVTTMEGVFRNSAFNGDISNWDISNVTHMNNMFDNSAFNNNSISNWDTSKVTNMNSMFTNSAFNGDISNWDTSKVTSMNSMFQNNYAFNGDVSNWDTSNVTNMASMFYGTPFNGDLSRWDISNVTRMEHMFEQNSAFNNDSISNWDISNVTHIYSMFSKSTFNGDISNWDTSNVTQMGYMFSGNSAFNGDISNWDTSSVTIMAAMFNGNSVFNGDISNWDTSNVTRMEYMFQNNSAFNGDISNWDISNVTHIYSIFKDNSAFNGDISDWDTSNVTNMSAMFYNNSTFNGDISSWDTSNVTNMAYMFYNNSAFNNNLSSWCVQSVTAYTGFNTQSVLSGANLPPFGTSTNCN